ncbi:oxidoreductase domain-containing protein [Lophiotrema nucula]|uniref:D-xylose 1-dehydrogenase (NADP(+), D-xylono-1,5-lactone-forming) n=1 Tax=Lophiotrema nucula TaxID=690887 RepID=A0A6A5YPV7_9PLEO|nr:oxidoreductase domain-containing protein [Lophiotrema nucula]
MSSVIGFVKRNYTVLNPPTVAKSGDVLRFGILGAANIAPMGIIVPAKTHPEVIVAAVAARDRKKAEAYAKKHQIPIVHDNYDNLINDPSLDCIYNPLPNGLHYEWTIKALKAGKHVLLEKPSVSNATEAKSLFRHPLLSQPNAPVLLEAFHYRFHPAWQHFLTLFEKEDIEHVEVVNKLFAGMFPLKDIRFDYSLSGGALMDFGTYAISTVRQIIGSEPVAVTSARVRLVPEPYDQRAESAAYASYEFPNGATADITADLYAKGGYWLPALTKNWPDFNGALPTLTVKLKGKTNGLNTSGKVITFHNYMGPWLYHRIDIATVTETKDQQGKVVKSDKKVEYKKVYKWETTEEGKKGEDYWATYRYQLEEFVNRVKGRKGSGVWVDPEDSIRQMEMVDATYEKAKRPLRPTSAALDTSGP